MCDYTKNEISNEGQYEAHYLNEEKMIEKGLDLNIIKQEPECDPCPKTLKTPCYSNNQEDNMHRNEIYMQRQREHLIDHSDERNIKSGLVNPMAQGYGRGGKFSCDACGKQFPYLSLLKIHMVKHNSERKARCVKCDKRFKRKETLNKHMKYAHATEKSFQCSMCPKSFTLAFYLKGHILSHSEEKPFKCDRCPKTFKALFPLTSHKIQQHNTGGKFSCEECGKMYISNYKLKLHSVKHSKEWNFCCDVCDRKFKRKMALNCHKKYAHATEKPFQCEICRKSFAEAHFLKRHVSYHKKTLPFNQHTKGSQGVGEVETLYNVKVEPVVIYDPDTKRTLDMNFDIKDEIEEKVSMDVDIKQEQVYVSN